MIPKTDRDGFVRTGVSYCPCCGKKMNIVCPVPDGEPGPVPGDIVLCLYCTAILRLDENLMVRGMTDGEIEELLLNPEMMKHLLKVSQTIRYMRASRS